MRGSEVNSRKKKKEIHTLTQSLPEVSNFFFAKVVGKSRFAVSTDRWLLIMFLKKFQLSDATSFTRKKQFPEGTPVRRNFIPIPGTKELSSGLFPSPSVGLAAEAILINP